MNKKIIKYLLLCLCLISLSSCSKDDNESTPAVTEVVFVFFPWAENLTTNNNYLPSDLTEIKSAIQNIGNMDGYRVIVYRGNSATTAELFELRLKDGKVTENRLNNYSDIDQTSLTYLTNVFSDVRSLTNTSTYKMIIGGHGCGWLPSELTYNNLNKVPKKSFGGSSTQNIRIDISTLSESLNKSGIYPELLIFDACCMSNIETIYPLSYTVHYIIAPPSEQAAPGFPYNDIWSNIIGVTSVDNLKSLCDKYKQYYDSNHSGYSTTFGQSVSPANITLVNCQYLYNVADAMKEINSQTYNSQNSQIQRYDTKQNGVFFDLQSYVHAILQPETYFQYQTLYANLVSALSLAVPYFTHAGYYLANGDKCYPISSENTCGLSTSDPSVNSSVIKYNHQTDWWKATH